MKLLLTKDGHAVVRNGLPVYVLDNGTEQGIDGAAAMKLALSKHFEVSPVMASLKIPHDVAAAFFGDAFRIEGGKLVALEKSGIQMYSGTRHGEVATFDEALKQLVDRYPSKHMILRSDGAAPAAQQAQGESYVTRAQFDAMPQATRAKFFREGGRVGDGESTAAPNRPTGVQKDSGKTVSRAEFDVMPTAERGAYFKAGGTVVD